MTAWAVPYLDQFKSVADIVAILERPEWAQLLR
jgi:hypothetical protein